MRRLMAVMGVLLALAIPARAQSPAGSITGSVLDESGAALPGANVALSGPGGHETTSGADGKYVFVNVAPGNYTVTVSLAGFSSTSRPVTVAGPTVVPSITLSIALRGEEVVVTASRVESSLVNAPVTMTVVGQDVLASTPAQNYGDILRQVPGLNVIQMSARDINITSRQATSTLSNSQLALLDGRSLYLDFFGLILWDFVPANPADVKQIEVVRGPASAVWGANALTGVVNIITRTPREAPGGSIALTGGLFSRNAGTDKGQLGDWEGKQFGGNFSYAGAPNDVWSYRLPAGYFDSDPYSRPAGTVPRATHPMDPSIPVGGAAYPDFVNQGTKQPKVDLRVDQDLKSGGRILYSAGYAGTTGLVHTGIGPFDLKNGSYLGYGRVAYNKGGLKIAGYANFLDGKAPNLLEVDATTGQPINLVFKTQTYDLEIGYSHVVAERHILTYGGNARRNNFDISIAPNAQNRTELGAYFQDEIFFDKFRFVLGGRVDKFGNLDKAVFSPRVSAIFKPGRAHSIKLSFNQAFRAPSTINNYLDTNIIEPAPLGALAPLIPPAVPGVPSFALAALRGYLGALPGGQFPLVIHATGNPDLKEESINAYEISYSGTFKARTTVSLAFYLNDNKQNINFVTSYAPDRVYTPQNPPAAPGLPPALGSLLVGLLAQVPPQFGGPIYLPSTFTYLNLPGKLRQTGVEVGVDHAVNRQLSAFANYSYQPTPTIYDDNGNKCTAANDGGTCYPIDEVGPPAKNRFNLGINLNSKRFLGNLSVNYSDKAFWQDVLSDGYHGYTDSYTMVNATFGVKWMDGKLTTTVKGINLGNKDIQQHVFGDIIKRSVIGELRYNF